jgi:hypothetical protein
MESPKMRFRRKHAKVMKRGETRNPGKPELASKVVNPFTRALEPLL